MYNFMQPAHQSLKADSKDGVHESIQFVNFSFSCSSVISNRGKKPACFRSILLQDQSPNIHDSKLLAGFEFESIVQFTKPLKQLSSL